MKIKKDSFISGIWFCKKNKGSYQGEATIVLSKSIEGKWIINIRTLYEMNLGAKVSEQQITLNKETDEAMAINNTEAFYKATAMFFPDIREHIKIDGDFVRAYLIISENAKHLSEAHLANILEQ